MRHFRMIAIVLVSKRNNKIALVRQRPVAEPGSDIGFNPVHDLGIERQVVVGKIDVAAGKFWLREKDEPDKQNEPAQLHVR